jgi:outer membrane lipopolysaccharide assembly protein LptE/RlpB
VGAVIMVNDEWGIVNDKTLVSLQFTIHYSLFTILQNPHPSPPPEYRGREKKRRPRSNLTAALLLAPLLLLTGCGYHISGSAETEPGYQWHSLYRGDVKTVAVPIFANRTFYQHVEDELTTAIAKQLEAFTPYKVASRERADTILEGEILRVRLRTISRDRIAAVPQEQMYVIVVNFRWRDLRTGKVLVERRDYEQTASFYPTLAEDEWVGQQQTVERLATAIVGELQADWGREKQTTKPATSQPDSANQSTP